MRLKMGVAVAAVVALTQAAAATLSVIYNFVPVGQGEVESPCVDGLGLMVYNHQTGLTRLWLIMDDLAPNTTYSVVVSAGVDFVSQAGVGDAFTTNSRGQACLTTDLGLGDDLRRAVVEVFVWDHATMPDPFDPDAPPVIDPDAFFDVTPEEERAIGVGFP